MDKILEALKNLLPESDVKEVAEAVKEMLEQAKSNLETEYNEKLEEAYSELTSELTESEKVAEKGYEEAYAIIGDLRNRLELQGEEYKTALDEGYAEAFDMLKKEQEKTQNLEVEMYEEYDKKLASMKEYVVDKVDQFLQFKGQEIYEQAKRDVINDPRMAEHKVTLDKIIDLTANYLSDEGFNAISSSKLEETNKSLEEMKGQLKIMEARNIRLSTENTKLNEAVRQSSDLISESKKAVTKEKKEEILSEQKERIEKSTNVMGRGKLSGDDKLIKEFVTPTNSDIDQQLVLSGIKKNN